ncbi:porin [Paraburkholderia sp. CNPSo 3274]|uniref:porin n=1 Tax=Paraburkholderia sp. CNPSo 3274 TaxID=2940932 RepID=UPI0020B82E5E|nr:porin [Paraburkholderia sp. CNPSo 3274]MCP3713174.1 porin [Paraburkholderia sp. CNPSo 3274]
MLLFDAAVCYAQSSVTLYGVVDAGVEYSSKTVNSTGTNAGSKFALVDSGVGPSSFGLSGKEDLGSGTKAEFTLASGISVANGGFKSSNGNFFGQQAWVGLDGQFGQVKAGVQFSPFYLALFDTDPRQFSEFGSALVVYCSNVFVTGAFNSNAVSYTSPQVAGFRGSVMLALGGEAGDFAAGRQWSASLKYQNGAAEINAAIYDGNGGGTVQTPNPSTVEFEGRTLGASYTLESLTIRASFVNYKVAESHNNNVYGGGIRYQVTPFFDVNSGVWYTADRDDNANHSLLVAGGMNYFLSRRTALYLQIGMVSNHGSMRTGLAVSDLTLLHGVPGTTVGGNIGIRHTF